MVYEVERQPLRRDPDSAGIAGLAVSLDGNGSFPREGCQASSAVSAKTVTCQYATADGTAISGQGFPFDYVPFSGTLTIPAGQTTFQVSMLRLRR